MKISCGIKQLEKSPWEAIRERYPVRSRVKGTVTSVKPFGIFVKLEENIEGLVHVSEISRKKVESAEGLYAVGDSVEVVVLGVDVAKKKISLSIKHLEIQSEKDEMKKFDQINQHHRDANIKSVWYYSIFFPVVEILSAISVGLIIWWGAHGIIQEQVSFGTLVAFIMYISLLFRPMRELADKFNSLQMGMVSSERIFALLDTETGVRTMGTKDASNIQGEIRFENVWFAYEDENWVLRDVSFQIKPGQMFAIVGSTGAGKSTIISLINRFYDIQKGKILIDGVDIMDYDLESLRKRVALVMQDVFLFSDSIYNNITLYDENISEQEVVNASRMVGAHSFIEKLPDAFQFNVRERGSVLSSGQRQLISFIRAYVFKPAILILDEATSSLDSESEELIGKATQALVSNRTSIVIAHRLSTIQKADCILVMEKGKIVQSGTHEEMIREEGVYKNLYDIQFAAEMSA